MGRIAEGWKLSWPKRRGGPPIGHVRFTVNGQRVERSTGKTEKGAAAAEAASIYANALAGKVAPARKKAIAGDAKLVDLTGAWLDQLPNPPATVAIYEIYARQWVAHFRTIHAVSQESIEEFTKVRLRGVIRKTILKELSQLRCFLRWCRKSGHLAVLPVVPVPDAIDRGTRANPKRKIEPVPLSEKEALAIRKALPETARKWKGRERRPRAFFTVLWETGLRPITVHRFIAGTHYVKGANELVITDDVDKAHYGRTVSITPAARAALLSALPKTGQVIFPRCDYRKLLKAAGAKAGLPPEKVAGLTRYDFRHGRTTSLVRSTGNLLGTAQLVGHTQVSTTNRYLHPDREQGDSVIKALGKRKAKKK